MPRIDRSDLVKAVAENDIQALCIAHSGFSMRAHLMWRGASLCGNLRRDYGYVSTLWPEMQSAVKCRKCDAIWRRIRKAAFGETIKGRR